MAGQAPANSLPVSVIIVSYNTRDCLSACLASVLASTGVSLDVVVVDNNSADGSADMVAREFPGVRLIRSRENVGFAAANNLAIGHATAPFLLLLNPDTVLPATTIASLISRLDSDARIGICGPRVLNPDGSLQSCGNRYPTLIEEMRESTRVTGWLRRLVGPSRPLEAPSAASDVDWLSGCCLMARRQMIDVIGPLDDRYFLYGEELDWCFAARRAGWRVVVDPDITMMHHQGQSTSADRAGAVTRLVETRLRFYQKNYSLGQAVVVALAYVVSSLPRRWRGEATSDARLQGVWSWVRSLRATPALPRH